MTILSLTHLLARCLVSVMLVASGAWVSVTLVNAEHWVTGALLGLFAMGGAVGVANGKDDAVQKQG